MRESERWGKGNKRMGRGEGRKRNKGRDQAAASPPFRQIKASDGHQWLKDLGAGYLSVSGGSCLPFWLSLSGLAVPQERGLHLPPSTPVL